MFTQLELGWMENLGHFDHTHLCELHDIHAAE